jgi:FMN phosphatase YigB (HAD superfamily)
MVRAPAAIIFDWGNTLVDYPLETSQQQVGFISDALSAFLGQTRDLDIPETGPDASGDLFKRFNREAGDHRVLQFRQRAAAALGIDPASKLVEEIEQYLLETLSMHAAVIDGAADAIEACRKRDIKIAVLSNTPWGTSAQFWKSEIQRHGLVDLAGDVVVLCQDTGWRKPAADGFLECLSRLGVSRQNALMIGDSYASDIIGATKAGLSAIWFNRHRQTPADRTIRQLSAWREFTARLDEQGGQT